MLTWRVVLGGATVGVMIYAIYKLIKFIKYQGSHFNVPQVCLALEIIANICKSLASNHSRWINMHKYLISRISVPDTKRFSGISCGSNLFTLGRIFLFVVDPIGCYQQVPTVFSLFVNFISLPFGTATFVLITFYW